jgi:hypothetical protein
MGCVRVDDAFYDHPKLAVAGPLGMAQWIAALAWCNRNLSDGFVPRAVAKRLLDWDDVPGPGHGPDNDPDGVSDGGSGVQAGWVCRRLVRAGLWEEVEGGYRVHDYLDYQPSAAEVRSTQAKARERMARARARRQQASPDGAPPDGADEVTAEVGDDGGPAPDPDEHCATGPEDFQRSPSEDSATGSGDVRANTGRNDGRNARRSSGRGSGRSSSYPNPNPNPKSSAAAAAELAGLPPPLAELRQRLDAARLVVRWDKLGAGHVAEIERLLAVHGPARLVGSAQGQWQAGDPPAFAQAWIVGWAALPRPVGPAVGRCQDHETDLPCGSCRADRLVGAAS